MYTMVTHTLASSERTRFLSCPLLAGTLAAPATLALLVAKCLARLIDGTGPAVFGMGHMWFTVAAVGTVAVVLAQYTLLRACSRAAAQHARQRRIALTGTAEDCSTSTTADSSSSSKAKAQYSASIADLVSLIRADWALLVCAFTALVLAAVGQVMIPHYTGQMISIVVQGGRAAEFHRAALRLIGAASGCGECCLHTSHYY
jgi:hypothetical protein